MSTIAADLSPFYLARARANMAYWKRQRAPALELGGMDGTGVYSCFIFVRLYIDSLASSKVAYWKRQRAPALELGGMDGTGVWQYA
jgi:hypothetical protein